MQKNIFTAKWFKEFEELQRKERAQGSKLTSAQARRRKRPNRKPRAQAEVPSEPGSGSKNQGTSEPSPYPGHKQQE